MHTFILKATFWKLRFVKSVSILLDAGLCPQHHRLSRITDAFSSDQVSCRLTPDARPDHKLNFTAKRDSVRLKRRQDISDCLVACGAQNEEIIDDHRRDKIVHIKSGLSSTTVIRGFGCSYVNT